MPVCLIMRAGGMYRWRKSARVRMSEKPARNGRRCGQRKDISYTDALLEGLAPDGGLYVQTEYPQLTEEDLKQLKGVPYFKLALEIKKRLVGGTIPNAKLKILLQKCSPKRASY